MVNSVVVVFVKIALHAINKKRQPVLGWRF